MGKVLSQEQLFSAISHRSMRQQKSCSYLGSLGDETTNRNTHINCLNGQGAESRAALWCHLEEILVIVKKLFLPWFLGGFDNK
jgi:hypothetical protein